MAAVPEPLGADNTADQRLADGVQAAEPPAQDELTRRLRPMLERVCARIAHPADVDDLIALVLYQMIQAEARLLSAWDRRAPLDAYLAVAAARSCVEEYRRYQIIRAVGGEPPRPEADPHHPSEVELAHRLTGAAEPAGAAHAEMCHRCTLRLELARCALGRDMRDPVDGTGPTEGTR